MKRKMVVIGIFTLVFFSLGSQKSSAQGQADGQWTSYTTSDGLPYNDVGAIAFEPDGGLWCVLVPPGGGGVAHFDGKTWKHYTAEDSLGSDVILWFEHTLAVSSDGVLWVATFEGGVSRFEGEAWKTYTTENGLLSNSVSSVAIAPNGDLWCTHPQPDCGISHFDGETWTVNTPGDTVTAMCYLLNIAFDPDSMLWAGGGIVLRCHDESWTSFSTQTGMEDPVAIYMEIGPDGKIWISGGSGVSCYDGSEWTHYSFADIGAKEDGADLLPLEVDSENVLWIGVGGEGVFRYDGNSWTKFTPEGGPSLDNVYSITVAPDSTIWFGTEDGIFRYNEKAPVTKVPERNENKLTVYPNPFTDRITIKGNENLEACVSVFNVMGNLLMEESCTGKNIIELTTENLAKGIYFVQIAAKDKITAYKIVK
jgi:ligand-binding sensor domain-containing protein